jgi:hypothetical protein
MLVLDRGYREKGRAPYLESPYRITLRASLMHGSQMWANHQSGTNEPRIRKDPELI